MAEISAERHIPTSYIAYWDEQGPCSDADCIQVWRFLMVISLRLKNSRDRFCNNEMDTWPTGTVHRLLATMLYAKKIYADVKDDDMQYNRVHMMEQSGHGSIQDVINELNHQLTSRAALRQTNRKEAEIWVTTFHSAVMDAMNVEMISNHAEVRQAFPDCIKQTFGLPVVCWKYSVPLGIVLSNEKSVILNAHRDCSRECDCGRVSEKFKDASGHVVTTDLQIVEQEDLRKRMQAGTTFRSDYERNEFIDREAAESEEIQTLEASIDHYIDRCCEINEIQPYLFAEWRGVLLTRLQQRYDEVAATVLNEAATAVLERGDYSQYLKQFKRKYAIITADKAKNTYCIVCKSHLCKQIMEETQGSDTYEQCQQTEEQLVQDDFNFVKAEGLVTVTTREAKEMQNPPRKHTWFNEAVPTFGVSVKLHKKNTLRFMAKSQNTSLTQMSNWMSRSFKIMTLVSEEIWKSLFMKVGIITHSSWVIDNSKQVRRRMARMQEAGLKPGADGQQTYDFSTMYTSMKLECVEEKMKQYVDLVFEYQKQNGSKKDRGKEKVLLVKHKDIGGWRVRNDEQQRDTDSTKFITAETLKRWIAYLLQRLFVKVGDRVQRQVIGLPMGTSCSPFMANLVLYMFELEYFTEQVSKVRLWHNGTERRPRYAVNKTSKLELLKKLAHCTRYIDDLWNPLVETAVFQQVAREIYPEWLQLGLEHQGESVNYLDMTIWHTNGDNFRWHSKLYDKKVGLMAKGLKLNKFPHPSSKLSVRCKYGVITSQLHRYTVACTRRQDFIPVAVDLYKAYVDKGYNRGMIDRYFERFIRSHLNGKMAPGEIKRQYLQMPPAADSSQGSV